jgi:hypothetical protein
MTTLQQVELQCPYLRHAIPFADGCVDEFVRG